MFLVCCDVSIFVRCLRVSLIHPHGGVLCSLVAIVVVLCLPKLSVACFEGLKYI